MVITDLAIIGCGAIGRWLAERCPGTVQVIGRNDRLPEVPLVVEAAGHEALAEYGEIALAQGSDLLVASVGALADPDLFNRLVAAAGAPGSGRGRILLPAGALGGIDALAAAREGGLTRVRYTARKPAATLAAGRHLTGEVVLLDGTAREAALAFPKSSNVAATVALAGLGFDLTEVRIIADPAVTANIHTVEAEGAFGRFCMTIEGRPLPDNPRSSSLTAMSLLQAVRNRTATVVI
jgi:aspartate dehydrogenase